MRSGDAGTPGPVSRSGAVAVLQALLVTVLWSTSFVLMKVGLRDIPALSFAGLRYALAFLVLLPVWLRVRGYRAVRGASPGTWVRLALLGIIYYSVTQGAQFLALVRLPAVTISLLLSASALLVALLSPLLLRERPSALQWVGVALYSAGVLLYFWPLRLPVSQVGSLVIAVVAAVANALSSLLGRSVNRTAKLDPLTVTVVSMGIGGALLLATGVAAQGMPRLTLTHWAIVIWLAVVSSALAFTLWNRTLRTLTATQSSLLNNTMLFQIAILAWVFLGEAMSARALAGMLVASAGVAVAQLASGGAASARPRAGDTKA